ncbi:hypothetical protein NEOLEDRAFT_1078582 [Neolentinus lepideus HHB14362 ss-1]|uniref:F-box domain-containing protein n=1 Tax=Neolentinus lepideus HHB14362 ss-1 TaxID=1314782 RepID=A0A165N2K0_9AGAM|nr:hypothetical protein NEOLEDRAFT_1078582 [Neolentinus lepideus HHB14362 ss-1]
MRYSFDVLDDDILVYLLSFLRVPDILCLRQTCRRMKNISYLRTTWLAVSTTLKRQGCPFSEKPLMAMDAPELERKARRAYQLGKKWSDLDRMSPRTSFTFHANPENPIMNLRFLPGLDGRWIVTVSQGIWSVLAFWHFNPDDPGKAVKMAEWTRKGAFFDALVVNQDPESEATVAVSVSLSQVRYRYIDILQLRHNVYNGLSSLRLVTSIKTSHLPVALRGDILAMSDRTYETRILNWNGGGEAVLRDKEAGLTSWQYNRCLQVVFAHESILVMRARSVNMFPEPVLTDAQNIRIYESIASYSFGWIEAVAVNALRPCIEDEDEDNKLCSRPFRPLSILLREGSDDPWATDACTVTLLELSPDPSYLSIWSEEGAMCPGQCPYVFPPIQKHRVPSVRGFTRCSNLFFGRVGTALWIQPRARGHLGLTALDLHSQEAQVAGPAPPNESLMATVFPGPLFSPEGGERIFGKKLWTNELRFWVSMDYDEESGVIALGNNNGDITVLEL